MSYSLAKLDKTGSFLATSTSKLGKKEITIYPIQIETGNKFTISISLSTTFELDQNDEILSFEWIYSSAVSKGASKRKLSNGTNGKANGTSSGSYLAVTLKNKTVLIYSPFQNHVVNEVKVAVHTHSLTSSINSYWVLGSTEAIEFELNDSKPKNKIKLPHKLKQVSTIETISYQNQTYIALGGDRLILVNPSTQKIFVEFESGKTPITQIKYINETVLVSRKDSNIISVHSLSTESTKFLKASSNIVSLSLLNNTSVGALTSKGYIEIFEDFNKKAPSTIIKSNNSDVKFIDAITKDNKLLITWFDFEPKLKTISTGKLNGTVEIDVNHESKHSKTTSKSLEPITADIEPIKGYNVHETALPTLIEEKIGLPSELLQVLVSNEDQEKIKTVVTQLNNSTSSKLYEILSNRVELNPAESATLNNWLKWVLITNSNLVKSDSNIKQLKGSISKNLKQLPNLLSLQGRLELLQSQLQLRTQIAKEEVINGTEKIDILAKAQENIVYINGENDDGDDVIGSAGNSESDEDEDQKEGRNGEADQKEEDGDDGVVIDGEGHE